MKRKRTPAKKQDEFEDEPEEQDDSDGEWTPPTTTKPRKKPRKTKKQSLTSQGKRKAAGIAENKLKKEVKRRKSIQPEQVEQTTQVEPQRPRRKSTTYDRTTKPILVFASSYHSNAADMQIKGADQDIYFDQLATLELRNARFSIAHYYEFRQEVKDSATYHSGKGHPLEDFRQDDPYQPPYGEDEADQSQVIATHTKVQFKDEPGYSTDSKVVAGEWLTSYEVYFRWKVTALYGERETWTSDVVCHRVTSPYKGGADGEVTHEAAGSRRWTVDLPDRLED